MSKQTAATSTIEITSPTQILMLAFELGEGSWLLGFSAGFGDIVKSCGSASNRRLQRNQTSIGTRCAASALPQESGHLT